MLSGSAASICATSVEPQRDMWKINPSGAGPGSADLTKSEIVMR